MASGGGITKTTRFTINTAFAPLDFTSVSSNSLTVNWSSAFAVGAKYYVQLSTQPFPNSLSGNLATTTTDTFAVFSKLESMTTYYAEVSTDSKMFTTPLGSTTTKFASITHLATGLPVTRNDGSVSVIVPITWIVSKPAISGVEYGLTASYGTIATSTATTPAQFHSIVLPGTATPLNPIAVYHYRVWAKDTFGNKTESADQTFKTFKSGDGICSSENGESELLSSGDCRQASCNNVVGAYGLGDSSLSARLGSQLGVNVT